MIAALASSPRFRFGLYALTLTSLPAWRDTECGGGNLYRSPSVRTRLGGY